MCFLVAPWDTEWGCLEDTVFSRGEGLPPILFFEVFEQSGEGKFRHPNGSRVSSRAVPLSGLVSGGAWVGIRPQALVLSPQLSPHQCGLEGPVGKGRVRLLLCQEVCTLALACRARAVSGSSELILRSQVLFPWVRPSAPPQFPWPPVITAGRACWSLKFSLAQSSSHPGSGVNASSPLVL